MKQIVRIIGFLAFQSMILLSGSAPALAQSVISPEEREQFESIIRDYLIENPEVIVEAMQALEQRERVAAEMRRQEALKQLLPVLKTSTLTPVVGSEGATATLIEFFDYQCGYCKRMVEDIQLIMAEDSDLEVVFVEFPALGPVSVIAARAALAAKMQGKYIEYHMALMKHRGRLADSVIFDLASSAGLDVDRLKADMEKSEIENYLITIRELAEALDVTGTPTLIVGDHFIPGYVSADDLKMVIEDERSKTGSKAADADNE